MIIVSLLGVSHTWATEDEESEGFEVVGVEGKVVYWGPFASFWRAVKVDELIPLGSLVVVKEGAKVTYVTKSKGADQITVSTPLAFRIDGTEVREFSFKQEYIPIHADVTFVETESSPTDLALAWDRTIFFARSAIRGGAPPETKGSGGGGMSAVWEPGSGCETGSCGQSISSGVVRLIVVTKQLLLSLPCACWGVCRVCFVGCYQSSDIIIKRAGSCKKTGSARSYP